MAALARTIVAAAALTVLLVAGCTPTPLDALDVRELFADHTIEGDHLKKEFSFRSYYDPSGVFFSIRDGQLPPLLGRWWVEDDGKICIQWETDPQALCRNMIRNPFGGYRKVLIGKNGKQIVIVRYRSFTAGKGAEF